MSPPVQALKGYAQSQVVEIWLLVPISLMSTYSKIPIQGDKWPNSLDGKKVIWKIVGLQF